MPIKTKPKFVRRKKCMSA